MVVVAMSADVTRVAEAEITPDTGTWGNDGGGGGISDEPDVVYQGSTSQSRKISTSRIGRDYTHGSGTDMTAAATAHCLVKINATNSSALLARTGPALGVKMGSSSSAYHEYYLFGNDNYPPVGGFQIVPINPTISGYASEAGDTGSPTDSSILYWSVLADYSATSKSENTMIDAIDCGLGLNLVSGTGADPEGTWEDFVDYDEGTSANRWGFATSDLPAIFFIGQITIGATSAGTSTVTEFTDSGKTLIWRNGLVATGFHRLKVDLASASTITVDDCIFDSQGQIDNDGDRGYTTTEDSRPVFEAVGTTGQSTFTGCAFTNWASFVLTRAADFFDCKFVGCGTIESTGATLSGATFSGFTGAADDSQVQWLGTSNPSGNLDDSSYTMGANDTHAIEFDSASSLTINISNIDFSGYTNTIDDNAAPLNFLRTTGTITVNASGCTGLTADGYKSAGADVNIILDPVDVTVTTVEEDGTAVGSVQVFLAVSGSGDYPYQEAATANRNGSTTVTITHTAHGYSTSDKVLMVGAALEDDMKGVFTITVTDANTYTYISGSTTKNGPSACTSTYVLLYGLTNASTGIITMSNTWVADQSVAGNARKASASPFFKVRALTGTVTPADGVSISALMLPDE